MTTPVLLLTFLEDSASLDEIEGRVRSARPSDGCIVNVADKSEARSYEWTPFDLKIFNWRIVNLNGSTITMNHALCGGGIYNKAEANLTLGSINHNGALRNGGGIYNDTGLFKGNKRLMHHNSPNNIYPIKS